MNQLDFINCIENIVGTKIYGIQWIYNIGTDDIADNVGDEEPFSLFQVYVTLQLHLRDKIKIVDQYNDYICVTACTYTDRRNHILGNMYDVDIDSNMGDNGLLIDFNERVYYAMRDYLESHYNDEKKNNFPIIETNYFETM